MVLWKQRGEATERDPSQRLSSTPPDGIHTYEGDAIYRNQRDQFSSALVSELLLTKIRVSHKE